MSEPNQFAPPSPAPRERPSEQCEVIMNGGITSGVVYPWALAEFARRYRLRGLGGASAGAIGAALGAAAEFGRTDGGFDVLVGLPGELRDGKLGELFRPQRTTRPLLGVLLAPTGHDKPGQARGTTGRLVAVVRALIVGFPFATLLGVIPGAALLVEGILGEDWWLVAAAVVLVLIGFVIAMLMRLFWMLTRSVPKNMFGICSGTAVGGKDGFTDWLSDKIDAAAKVPARDKPLTFGQLWGTSSGEPEIDLRVVTTCLTQGQPYELPFETFEFFFDPAE
jgi:hypothetical protein